MLIGNVKGEESRKGGRSSRLKKNPKGKSSRVRGKRGGRKTGKLG